MYFSILGVFLISCFRFQWLLSTYSHPCCKCKLLKDIKPHGICFYISYNAIIACSINICWLIDLPVPIILCLSIFLSFYFSLSISASYLVCTEQVLHQACRPKPSPAPHRSSLIDATFTNKDTRVFRSVIITPLPCAHQELLECAPGHTWGVKDDERLMSSGTCGQRVDEVALCGKSQPMAEVLLWFLQNYP